MLQCRMVLRMCEDGVIGSRISSELPRIFRSPRIQDWWIAQTHEQNLLLGRRGFKPLPLSVGSRHLIFSHTSPTKTSRNRRLGSSIEPVVSLRSLVENYRGDFIVCGGETMFTQFLPYVNQVDLAIVNRQIRCSVVMPKLQPSEWRVQRHTGPIGDSPYPNVSFVCMERVSGGRDLENFTRNREYDHDSEKDFDRRLNEVLLQADGVR